MSEHDGRLIGGALVSIAIALWALTLAVVTLSDSLDDMVMRMRLVGISLRKLVPVSPDDRYTPPAPQAPSGATDADQAAGTPHRQGERSFEAHAE